MLSLVSPLVYPDFEKEFCIATDVSIATQNSFLKSGYAKGGTKGNNALRDSKWLWYSGVYSSNTLVEFHSASKGAVNLDIKGIWLWK